MALWWGVLVSTTTWTTIYYAIKSRCEKEPEWCCRLLTAIHASIVTTLAALSCLCGPWPFTDPGGPNTFIQCLTLVVSLGYFIFDIIWCLYHQTEGMTMLIHHAVSIIAITRVLMKGASGTEAVAGLGGLEITNPLLQIRWFLRSSGYKDTVIFFFVEIIFMILFFIMRILLGSYLFITTAIHPVPDLEAKLLAGSFYVLNWVFMVYITQYFLAKYIHRKHKIVCSHENDHGEQIKAKAS